MDTVYSALLMKFLVSLKTSQKNDLEGLVFTISVAGLQRHNVLHNLMEGVPS